MHKHVYRPAFLTIILLLAGSLLSAQARKEEPPTELHVNTMPANANIYVDGTLKGASPAVLSGIKPGAHLVVVKRKGYREARQTVSLKSAQRRVLEMRLDVLTGIVIVNSTPKDAEVELDGASKGVTPLLLTDVPFGKHRLKVKVAGHMPKELDLMIKDRIPRKIDVDLTSDSGSLVVDSVPSGARITLNGINKGTTPCTVAQVVRGESNLEISLEGYEMDKRSVKLSPGQTERITVKLRPLPSSIMVFSIPEGARIYVNNEFRGDSPVTITNLVPGSYRIRAELAAHKPEARTIELVRGKTAREEFRFESNAGTLQITTQPAGASIHLDGKDMGRTEAKGTDRVSEPLMIHRIVAGSHQVTVAKKGCYDRTLKVEIGKDETTTRHIALRRRFIPNYEVRTGATVYTGVFVRTNPNGDVILEIRPGVFKTIGKSEIVLQNPLRANLPGDKKSK